MARRLLSCSKSDVRGATVCHENRSRRRQQRRRSQPLKSLEQARRAYSRTLFCTCRHLYCVLGTRNSEIIKPVHSYSMFSLLYQPFRVIGSRRSVQHFVDLGNSICADSTGFSPLAIGIVRWLIARLVYLASASKASPFASAQFLRPRRPYHALDSTTLNFTSGMRAWPP